MLSDSRELEVRNWVDTILTQSHPMLWQQMMDAAAQQHELALAKTPDDERAWLDYFGSRTDFKAKVFVLERAVRHLPQNRLLWSTYLDVVLEKVSSAGWDYYHHKQKFLGVNRLFQRCLNCLAEAEIWHKYLQFLVVYQYNEIEFVNNEFTRFLRRCPIDTHDVVWPMYLEYADLLDDITSVSIYLRYLQFDNSPENPTIDQILYSVAKHDTAASYELFTRIIYNAAEYTLSRSLASIWLGYLEQILPRKPKFFPDLCRKGVKRFPDQLSKFSLLLIAFTEDVNLKKQYFKTSITECSTLADFTALYEKYLMFEEAQIDVANDDTIDDALDNYEKLINDRPILLNDMLLRRDVNNLDTWFERLEVLEADLNKLLTTYVEAITSINPLKCYSPSGENTLSKLWISYSQVYSGRNDLKTAYHILEKSVKSKFSSIDDLIAIYRWWCELLLQENKTDKALGLLESILFQTSDTPFNYNDPSIDMHLRLSKSEVVWSFYLETLEVYLDDVQKIEEGYNKLIEAKLAKPVHFFNLAEVLEEVGEPERALNVYEKGLKVFKNPEISFYFYNTYLGKLLQKKVDIERTRDLFDQALAEIPANLAVPIIILYSQFEFDNGLILKSLALLKDNLLKIDNPYDIAITYIQKLEGLQNKDDLRSGFQYVLGAKFSNHFFIRLVERFISFEASEKQFSRVRHLYRYLFESLDPKGLNHAEVKQVWANWEHFEVHNGDESTFKSMLRFKRTIKFDDSVRGFVKGKDTTKESQNPDQIDINM